jgi:glycosyltransferase involved in cell wall biosynthesis
MSFIYEGAISSTAMGGARLHFRGMARALERAEVPDLHIVLPKFRGEEMYDPGVGVDVRVHGVRTLRRSLVGHLCYEVLKSALIVSIRLRDIARRRPTVHMTRIAPIGVAPAFMRVLGAKVVVEVNGMPDDEFEARGFPRVVVGLIRLITSLQLRSGTHVVAVTDGVADLVRSRTSGAVMRLENAVDLADIESQLERASDGDRFTIVYSGAFAPWQELVLLVHAFAALVEGRPDAPWRLLLIGDGEDRDQIERAIEDCGVSEMVEITGWVDRVEAADRLLEGLIAVVPLRPKSASGICGSPLKLFEYLALGRTVVGSDVDGIVELVDYPVTVYRHGDIESLREALETVAGLANDPSATFDSAVLTWDDRCQRLLDFVQNNG